MRKFETSRNLIHDSSMGEYIDNILAENLTLKRKLESKCEAISILNSEAEKAKIELGRMKEIINELKAKKMPINNEQETYHGDSGRSLQLEIHTLRQKLRDAQGDVQALRSQLSYDKPPCNDINISNHEELVELVEKLQISKINLECDYQTLLDEKDELVTERDAYKCKLHRLNHECNVLLKGDTSNLIDLDALVLENRFLQERLLQLQEENKLSKQISERYKSLLHSKKSQNGEDTDKNGDSGAGILLTQKQAREFLENCVSNHLSGDADIMLELRSLCVTLLDGLSDKSLALSHQKRANKILASRIAQLEAHWKSSHSFNITGSPSKILLEGYQNAEVGSEVAVAEGASECKGAAPT